MSEKGSVYFMEIPSAELEIPQVDDIIFEVVTQLNNNDINEVVQLNNLAVGTIKGGVDHVPIRSLANRQNGNNGEIIVICRIGDHIRGYGYGHTDNPSENGIFYINTIYIAKEFRKRKAAENILLELINEGINQGNYTHIKAVVHDENKAAQNLILKYGFKKLVIDNSSHPQ